MNQLLASGLVLFVALSMSACSKKESTQTPAPPAAASSAPSSQSDAVLVASEVWVRSTVPEQKATGAFATIKAQADGQIVAARSEVAGVTEIHEMKMEGDVMRMRALDAIPFKAGDTISLAPGGNHIMLMDLKKPITEGEQVSLVLTVKKPDGSTVEVPLQAKAQSGMNSGHAAHKH